MEWLLLKKSKGQVFSADTLLGLLVFLFALSIVFFYTSQLFERQSSFFEELELKTQTFNALSSLVETKGFPSNWEFQNIPEIKAFGIASSPGIVDSAKLESFLQISQSDYDSVRKTLGLSKFNYRLSINDLNGESVAIAGSDAKGLLSFKASRLALLNNEAVLVSLEAFK